jgi:hypothetical protein
MSRKERAQEKNDRTIQVVQPTPEGISAMTKLDKSDFTITSDDDEIRVDGLCRDLLKEFHSRLLQQGVAPLEAGALAHGADYFIRDFVISARRRNLFQESENCVRPFAATWYIISNLEPTAGELAGHLKGVREFYRFLRSEGLISGKFLEMIEKECNDIRWYRERIESFWEISDDGYLAWERECSLKER